MFEAGTEVEMTHRLGDFLAEQIRDNGLRSVAARTGIAVTSLKRLAEGETAVEIETLRKISRTYKIPLWQVMEWVGINLDLPRDADAMARRIESLRQALPEFEPVIDEMFDLDVDDFRGVMAYLEALKARRQRRG